MYASNDLAAGAEGSCSYLNHNGIDQEGLYRIPGSVTEVKRLESIFDRGLWTLSLRWGEDSDRSQGPPMTLIFWGPTSKLTTSTSSAQCSRLGCENSPTSCSHKRRRRESTQPTPRQQNVRRLCVTSSPVSLPGNTTSSSPSHATSASYTSTRQRTRWTTRPFSFVGRAPSRSTASASPSSSATGDAAGKAAGRRRMRFSKRSRRIPQSMCRTSRWRGARIRISMCDRSLTSFKKKLRHGGRRLHPRQIRISRAKTWEDTAQQPLGPSADPVVARFRSPQHRRSLT